MTGKDIKIIQSSNPLVPGRVTPQRNSPQLIPTEYQLESQYKDTSEPCPVTFRVMHSPFYEGEKWCVRRNGMCLNKGFQWEYEPQPSSRDEDFYERCRFDSFPKAVECFVNGGYYDELRNWTN